MQSYPKVLKSSSERTGNPRKRRFHGNQFHNVSSSDDGEANTSRSEKKLVSATTDDVIIYPSHCYRIIEFVSKCLGGHTQNANESFNSTVWRIASKHLNSGFKIIEIAAYIAEGMFNEGYSTALKTMQLFDLKIGQQCNKFAKGVDKERVTRQNRRDSLSSKEARTTRRLEHQDENQFFEESEGQLYVPGIAD
ncbi:hypothetical protein M0802_013027 [Mischocyttarus mexicanus]|nr:hypothetical protein M0802_013027 [Mischocyttarus mexicanus]